MKKVLIIGMGNSLGGVEKFILDLYREIDKSRIQFDFLMYRNIFSEASELINNFGGKIYYVPKYSSKPIQFLKYISEFYNEHNDYNVIHCHASHASVIMYTLPCWFKSSVKIIFHSHNSQGNCLLVHKFFRVIVKKRADELLACSKVAAEWMYGKNVKVLNKVKLINNGICIEKFRYNMDLSHNLKEKYGLINKIVFGHIGEFREQKNHMFLIDIFKCIHEKEDKAVLLLVGDGDMRFEIEEKVRLYNLNESVVFIGRQNNVEKIYQIMDVFLLPSLYEGLPFVGVEAQAAGLLTIFSNNVSKESKITDCAIFIDLINNANDWANIILKKSKNYNRKDTSEQIRSAGYDFRNSVKILESIYIGK